LRVHKQTPEIHAKLVALGGFAQSLRRDPCACSRAAGFALPAEVVERDWAAP